MCLFLALMYLKWHFRPVRTQLQQVIIHSILIVQISFYDQCLSARRDLSIARITCLKKSVRWGSTRVLTRQLQVVRKSPEIEKQEQPSIGAGTGDRKQSIAPILGLACARGQAGPLRENGSVFMSFIDPARCTRRFFFYI